MTTCSRLPAIANVMAAFELGDTAGHLDAVFAAADRSLRTEMHIGRIAGAPMECRGIVAATDHTGKLTVWTSTQAPHAVRHAIKIGRAHV